MNDWSMLLPHMPPPRLLRARPVNNADEVLICSYTADLRFVEQVALPEVRAIGARLTVVHDADRTLTPAHETRFAGTGYTDVPVRCASGGEFHPKVIVITGADRTVVAIGSGNATSAGWHHSGEVWTQIAATPDAWPDTFHAVADWLDTLPTVIVVDHFGVSRLHDVAALLRAHHAVTTGPTVVHNISKRIADQLPEMGDDVDSLLVVSPFLDPGMHVLQRLERQLRPGRVTLALTRNAQATPGTLRAWTSDNNHTLQTMKDQRYYHGKVVQWSVGHHHSALVGSANCTVAALCKTTIDGGNCELGLILDRVEDLGAQLELTVLDLNDIDEHLTDEPDHTDRGESVPLLLRVLRNETRLTASVFLPASHPPVSHAALIADNRRLDLHGQLTSGSASVLEADNAHNASAGALCWLELNGNRLGSAVRLTDADLVLSAPGRGSPLDQNGIAETLTNPKLAAQLFEALTRLAEFGHPRPDMQGAIGFGAGRTSWHARARSAVGSALIDIALGMPARTAEQADTTQLPDPANLGEDDPEWARQTGETATLDAGAGANETDNADDGWDDVGGDGETDIVDVIEQLNAVELLQFSPEQARSIARRIDRVTAGLSGSSLPYLMVLQRFALLIAAAGGWDRNERDTTRWITPVVAILGAIAESNPAGDVDLVQARAAIAVVSLAVLDSEIDWSERSELADRFETMRQQLALDVATLDAARVSAFAEALDTKFGATLTSHAVLDAAEHLAVTDQLARRVDALLADYPTLERVGALVVRMTVLRNPFPAALRLIGKLDDLAPVLIRVEAEGEAALLAWQPPLLVVHRSQGVRQWGSAHTTTSTPSAHSYALLRASRKWRGPIPAEVITQLSELHMGDDE